jgi:hypothetical protein
METKHIPLFDDLLQNVARLPGVIVTAGCLPYLLSGIDTRRLNSEQKVRISTAEFSTPSRATTVNISSSILVPSDQL